MSTPPVVPLTIESPSVTAYLGQLQGIINRLAGQSAACKNWTAALITGLVIFALEKEAKFPICSLDVLVLLLAGIDAYYLSMERDFIKVSNAFVTAIHDGSALWSDVFATPKIPQGIERIQRTFKASLSLSVWPFYGVLFAVPLLLQIYLPKHCEKPKHCEEPKDKPAAVQAKASQPVSPATAAPAKP